MKNIILATTILLAVPNVAELTAQEPELRPVRSYLTSGDLSNTRYFARRCTALYVLLSPKLRERGEDSLAENMEKFGAMFLVVARQTDVKMGASEDTVDASVLAAIGNIMDVLTSRMNRHMAVTGNFFVGDQLIESDLRTCGEVGEELTKRREGKIQ